MCVFGEDKVWDTVNLCKSVKKMDFMVIKTMIDSAYYILHIVTWHCWHFIIFKISNIFFSIFAFYCF